MSDIEIARAASMQPIAQVADKVGIPEDALEPYGRGKAKLSQEFVNSLEGRPDGKVGDAVEIEVRGYHRPADLVTGLHAGDDHVRRLGE